MVCQWSGCSVGIAEFSLLESLVSVLKRCCRYVYDEFDILSAVRTDVEKFISLLLYCNFRIFIISSPVNIMYRYNKVHFTYL